MVTQETNLQCGYRDLVCRYRGRSERRTLSSEDDLREGWNGGSRKSSEDDLPSNLCAGKRIKQNPLKDYPGGGLGIPRTSDYPKKPSGDSPGFNTKSKDTQQKMQQRCC